VHVHLHWVHKKPSQRIFSIMFFIEDGGNFIKFGGLVPESTQDTTSVAFPTKPVLGVVTDLVDSLVEGDID